jgi:tetratricopeptide (TPR) repeat protein
LTDGRRFLYTLAVESAQTNYRLVRDAYQSLNKKRFQEAILTLEKALASGAGDIYVLLLLAVAYLYTDQFGKLARFITKMNEMNPSYMPLIQLDAFLKLKSAAGQSEALKLYIDLTARYPADPHIHRGRNLIGSATDFSGFQKNAHLQDFVSIPRPSKKLKKPAQKTSYVGKLGRRGIRIEKGIRGRRWIIMIVVLFAVAALASLSAWFFMGRGYFGKGEHRVKNPRADYSGVDMLSLAGTEYDLVKNIKRERVAVYYQSVRDMTDDFNRARKLIKAEKYNDALYIMNGLYNSNVNFVVKEKVDFLIKFVIDLEDRDFEEVPVALVNGNKHRYRGYAVRWKGRIERAREREESQILTIRLDSAGDEAPCDADVYSRKIIPGLKKDSRVLLEGVIFDFIGKDRRAYIVSRSLKVLK